MSSRGVTTITQKCSSPSPSKFSSFRRHWTSAVGLSTLLHSAYLMKIFLATWKSSLSLQEVFPTQYPHLAYLQNSSLMMVNLLASVMLRLSEMPHHVRDIQYPNLKVGLFIPFLWIPMHLLRTGGNGGTTPNLLHTAFQLKTGGSYSMTLLNWLNKHLVSASTRTVGNNNKLGVTF